MIIKDIIITGFKTFGSCTTLGPFFPGINVLVGYNGSGKTSILDAIEFVFGNSFQKLTDKKFSELKCHDIRKQKKNFIKVEIILDNTDDMNDSFPQEFSIIRYKTKTEDYYYVNKEKIIKSEFLKLITPLGIRVSLLKQGEAIKFAAVSDEKRWDLLIEKIGYEKITFSNNDEWNSLTQEKNKKMAELSKYYNKLEKEQKHLIEFQELLKKKEFINYQLRKINLPELNKKLQQYEKNFNDWLSIQGNKIQKYINLKSKLDQLNSQLSEANNLLKSLENTEETITRLIEQSENEKDNVEGLILISKDCCKQKEHFLTKKKKELELLEEKITSLEQTHLSLREQLMSEKEKYLEDEHHLKEKMAKKLSNIKNEISSTKAEIESLKRSKQENLRSIEIYQDQVLMATNLSITSKTQKLELLEKLSSLYDSYDQNSEKLQSVLKYDIMYSKSTIENAIELINSESSIRKINLERYHGFVIDCFEYSEDVEAVILAVASQYLFCAVLDYGIDTLAIVERDTYCGYLAILSLDRLQIPNKALPTSSEAVPLISLIKYAPTYEKLVEFMFGNVVICKDKKVALEYSEKYDIICSTIKGDVFYGSATSEGGNWNEHERNQICIYKTMMEQYDEIKRLEAEEKEIDRNMLSLDEAVVENLRQKQLLELQNELDEKKLSSLENKIRYFEFQSRLIIIDDNKYEEIEDALKGQKEKLENLESNSPSDDDYDEEKKIFKLNNAINRNLMILIDDLEKKNDLQNQIGLIMADIEMETNFIKNNMKNLKHKAQILDEETLKLEMFRPKITELQENLKTITTIKKQKENQADKLKMKIDAHNQSTKNIKIDYETMLEAFENEQDKDINYTNISHMKADPELKNIEKLTQSKLLSLQMEVDIELKKIKKNMNINAPKKFSLIQKDFEQVNISVMEVQNFKARIEKLHENIKMVIQAQAYEDLEKIDNHLKYFINKFLSHDRVSLVLKVDNKNYTVDEAKKANIDIDNVTGMSIRLFENNNGAALRLNELSGGQNTILSVALMLAIHKCRKISIILWDEVDQALDKTHRQTLREICEELTCGGQIFLTTFRPELAQAGDNFYLVEKNGHTSNTSKANEGTVLEFLGTINH